MAYLASQCLKCPPSAAPPCAGLPPRPPEWWRTAFEHSSDCGYNGDCGLALNFRLPFSETGPTFPLSQLSTARHWQDAESMITERWQSGRSRRTRNAVDRKVPGVRIPPSPPSFALWASDGTANFAKNKICAGGYSATAKDALRSLGEGGPFPMGFGWHGQF